MKKVTALLLALLLIMAAGCGEKKPPETGYTKYSTQFYGTFDTIVQIIGYAQSEEEFVSHAKAMQERFEELHRLYDIYYDYAGVNNLKTVNDNAGISPVEVPKEILDLLEFGTDWYQKTDGQVNIAMGSVLSIWHQYISRYAPDDTETELPSMEKLRAALDHTDITKVKIDREAGTVYLEDPEMSLDVGAVAKGYAAELVAREAYERGFTSFIMSAGGNIVAGDPPLDGVRSAWGVGIQDPETVDDLAAEQSVDVAFVTNTSVVTSGDYQRYYFHEGERIHHIIDPGTLQPAKHYRGVTIITEKSGEADLASTALFTLPLEESQALADKMGWKVLWILEDGTVLANDGILPLLRDRGGASAEIAG